MYRYIILYYNSHMSFLPLFHLDCVLGRPCYGTSYVPSFTFERLRSIFVDNERTDNSCCTSTTSLWKTHTSYITHTHTKLIPVVVSSRLQESQIDIHPDRMSVYHHMVLLMNSPPNHQDRLHSDKRNDNHSQNSCRQHTNVHLHHWRIKMILYSKWYVYYVSDMN